MMNYQYSNYILRHLIHSMLLITLSLTSIVWLTQALRFIDVIVSQGVSITVFLTLTGLLVPSLLLMILPPALFCAIVFTYHKLISDSELMVMQAAGLSRWRLSLPALQMATLVMLLCAFIAHYLQPVSYKQFKDLQIFLRNNYISILLQDGVFSNPVAGLTVFIRERDSDGGLRGILVHDNRLPEAAVTMLAEEGRLVQTPQGPRFLLMQGNRQENRDGKLSFLDFERYTLDISLYTGNMAQRPRDSQELFLSELLWPDPAQAVREQAKRRAEGHQRILWPFYSITIALVALAALLSGEFNRRGHWQRVAVAVAFAVLIMFGSVGMRGAMAFNPFFIPVAYLACLFPGLIAARILTDRAALPRPA